MVEAADGLTSRAGVPLGLETMRALGLDQVIVQHVRVRARQSGYTEAEKIEALVLLLAAGGACLDDIAILSLPALVTTFAFRADTACDNEPTRTWLAAPARPGGPAGPIGFPSGADLTKDLHAVCASVAAGRWQRFEDRPDVAFTPGTGQKDAPPLRYLALRIRKKQGQLFASGADTKYRAVVSTR